MTDEKCRMHPEYDGYGEPPDPECRDCEELRVRGGE
jgi:hypothetical protein